MLKLGDKNINKLYVGDKAISKAYYGDKLVYRNYPIFLDYISFDGASYIDTGIVPTDNTGAYIKYTNTGDYKDSIILGYRGEVYSSMRSFLLASYHGSVSIGRGVYAYLRKNGEWGTAQDFSTLNTNTEVWSNYLNSRVVRAKFGDTDVTSVEISEITFTSSGSLFLGAENQNNTNVVNYYKGKIDRCVITEGEAIIQDLRPCIVAGQAGFYDMVTKKYFYNQGTGTLTYTE